MESTKKQARKHFKPYILSLVLTVVAIISVLMLLLTPTQSIWYIAESIRSDEDCHVIWISDSQHHFHSIGDRTEAYSKAIQCLNGLKISQKSIGKHSFDDGSHMIVLENPTDFTVQYFLFNEDFTRVWAIDNSWIPEHREITQYEEICPVYRVQNPWKVKRFFKGICNSDSKYDFENND